MKIRTNNYKLNLQGCTSVIKTHPILLKSDYIYDKKSTARVDYKPILALCTSLICQWKIINTFSIVGRSLDAIKVLPYLPSGIQYIIS